MKHADRFRRKDRMSHDAFAGFLQLWITPAHAPVKETPELAAYLRHLNSQFPYPLTDSVRRAVREPTDRAA